MMIQLNMQQEKKKQILKLYIFPEICLMNEADRNTPNKKQKQTKKKQYKWLKGDLKKNSEIYNFLWLVTRNDNLSIINNGILQSFSYC